MQRNYESKQHMFERQSQSVLSALRESQSIHESGYRNYSPFLLKTQNLEKRRDFGGEPVISKP